MTTKNSKGIRYSPETLIKHTAYELGFSEVGIAGIEPTARSHEVFDRWIEAGKHGDMRYLSGGADKRHDPSILLDGARSAVCVALNYYREDAAHRDSGDGAVAMYAYGPDYHVVLHDMLTQLQTRLLEIFPGMRSNVQRVGNVARTDRRRKFVCVSRTSF